MARRDEHHWMHWEPSAWLDDQALQACGATTRGCWMNWLMLMWKDGAFRLRGDFAAFGRWAGCSAEDAEKALNDLKAHRAASVTRCNGFVTLLSRRLKRDDDERKSLLDRVNRHREKSVTPMKRSCNARVTRVKHTEKRREEKKREEKKKPPPPTPANAGDETEGEEGVDASLYEATAKKRLEATGMNDDTTIADILSKRKAKDVIGWCDWFDEQRKNGADIGAGLLAKKLLSGEPPPILQANTSRGAPPPKPTYPWKCANCGTVFLLAIESATKAFSDPTCDRCGQRPQAKLVRIDAKEAK
jgi:hypothetical protein